MCHLKHLKYDTVFQLSIVANQITPKLDVFDKLKEWLITHKFCHLEIQAVPLRVWSGSTQMAAVNR